MHGLILLYSFFTFSFFSLIQPKRSLNESAELASHLRKFGVKLKLYFA